MFRTWKFSSKWRVGAVLWAITVSAPVMGESAADRRVFPYMEAEAARWLARRECKPLVIHFVPDTPIGARQLNAFYTGPDQILADVLNNVVIVVAPSEKYHLFAGRLGLTTPGGFRTVSGYDLSPVDGEAVPTVQTGFR